MTDHKAQLDRAVEIIRGIENGATSGIRVLEFHSDWTAWAKEVREETRDFLKSIEAPEVKGCGGDPGSPVSIPCSREDKGAVFKTLTGTFERLCRGCPDCQPKPETVTREPLVMPNEEGYLSYQVGKLWDHVAELTKRLNDMEVWGDEDL